MRTSLTFDEPSHSVSGRDSASLPGRARPKLVVIGSSRFAHYRLQDNANLGLHSLNARKATARTDLEDELRKYRLSSQARDNSVIPCDRSTPQYNLSITSPLSTYLGTEVWINFLA